MSLVGLRLGNITKVKSKCFSAHFWQRVALEICLLPKMKCNTKSLFQTEHVHDMSYEWYEGWEYHSDRWSIVQKTGDARTDNHQGMIKHLSFNINWLIKNRTRRVWHFLQAAGFSYRGETHGFTEHVATVTDSELSWTGFVKPKTQSFPHLRVNKLKSFH